MRFARVTGLGALLLVVVPSAPAKAPPTPVEAKVVATGRAPCGVVAYEGALWVGVYGTGAVLRINPTSGRITKRIRTGAWPCRVAVDRHALWITRDRAGVVLRIDRRTGRRRIIDLGRSPFDVLLAAGSVWVTSYEVGTIARLDPATGRPVSVAREGDFPAGLTSCKDRIWVGHGRDATWLTSIAPASGELQRVEVGAQTPGWPRCIGGELWVTTLDSVVRVDPESGTVRARIRLGGTPADAGAGPDGLIWVTDKERSLIDRIDPRTNKLVDSFPAGPGAFAFARVRTSMWVTSFAGTDIRRYDP
jgi:streptogramin lyase